MLHQLSIPNQNRIAMYWMIDAVIPPTPEYEMGYPTKPHFRRYWNGGSLLTLDYALETGYLQMMGINTLIISCPAKQRSDIGLDAASHYYHPIYGKTMSKRYGHSRAHLQAVIQKARNLGVEVVLDSCHHVYETSRYLSKYPDAFEGESGFSHLRTLRVSDLDVRNTLWKVFKGWMEDSGAVGIRVDSASYLGMEYLHALIHDQDSPVFGGWSVAEALDPQNINSAEHFGTWIENTKMPFYDYVTYWAMCDSLTSPQGDLRRIASVIKTYEDLGVPHESLVRFLANQDMDRYLWLVHQKMGFNFPEEPGNNRFKMGYTVLFTLPGVPLHFMGECSGKTGTGWSDRGRHNREPIDFDEERLFQPFFQKLAELRLGHTSLTQGSYRELWVTPPEGGLPIWAYARGDEVVVIVNNGTERVNLWNICSHPDDDDEVRGINVSELLQGGAHPNVLLSSRETDQKVYVTSSGRLQGYIDGETVLVVK